VLLLHRVLWIQFFRADSAEFRKEVLLEWLEGKFAQEWHGRFGSVAGDDKSGEAPDFFGLPSNTPVYHGVGGMHAIACGVLQTARAQRKDVDVQVHIGTRVAKVERVASGTDAGRWELLGTTGDAALHDSNEELAAQAQLTPCSPLRFDALLVTDISASFEGWHRASAGLPANARPLLASLSSRVRVPLFTALVAFAKPIQV
jgi:hypothetical protein